MTDAWATHIKCILFVAMGLEMSKGTISGEEKAA